MTSDAPQEIRGLTRRAVVRNGLMVGLGTAAVVAASAPLAGRARAGASIPASLASPSTTAQTQENWYWCDVCQGMWYGGYKDSNGNIKGGVCPYGDGVPHAGLNAYTTSNYYFYYGAVANSNWQGNWWWCGNCYIMYWGGTSAGVCPANGGAHTGPSSRESYVTWIGNGTNGGQTGWRYCRNCHSMFWAGTSGTNTSNTYCPDGGNHTLAGSHNYPIPSVGTVYLIPL